MSEQAQFLPDRPRIDSFVTADWAEALNGKLYLMGGGFDTLFAPQFPFTARFSFAAILRVPWGDTNRRFPVTATVRTTDGADLGWQMQGELEAGRPPGARVGDVSVAIAGVVMFEVEHEVEFTLQLAFADDRRELPLRIVRTPFQMTPNLPPPPA